MKLQIKKESSQRVGLYIRVSTEEQAANPEGSIKSQEQRLREQLRLKNQEKYLGEVTEVFIDRALSGKDIRRPELQRMLLAISRGEITLVMVSELSRLSRSIKDFSNIWELMQRLGCGFLSLRENFDTTTAAGEMVLYTVANIAQFERKQCSERIRANLLARAERGLFNGGSIPVGYELDVNNKGSFKVNEEHALVVRECFKSYLTQGTLVNTAKFLNERGLSLPKVKRNGSRDRIGIFTVDNLHDILRNKSYMGIRTFTDRNGKTKGSPGHVACNHRSGNFL